jgi:hypothetical protein
MQFKIDRFKNMPYVGKMGLSLWLVGWIWLIAMYYYLTQDSALTIKLSISVVILVPFLFQSQNWARIIALLGNAMGIFISVLFYYKGLVMIATVNVLLFGGSIYFLMVPATSRYFKTHTRPGRQNN